ncbi:MAG: helix-turn-helix transcriptional regulator [Prevotella sp.]|nr:helix-turn-helix transcriptional regulator [Prevotella sp.]MBR6188502.1 helix-turn-helix transcriptional regulator [Prevotella sp.]
MKNLVHVFLMVAAMAISCTNGNSNGSGNVADADSIYQWENVRKYLMEEPERALRMLDTAEVRGVMDVNEANHWRACIYYSNEEIEDFDKAKDYCMMVLSNTNPACDSAQYLKTLNQLVSILQVNRDTYPEAIRYAMEGAQRAHNAGDVRLEAAFYYDMGLVMENIQYGSGMKYMDRCLDILREASCDDLNSLPVLESNLGNAARRLAQQGNNARAIELLEERLQVLDRIDREIPTAPKGFCDEKRALTYSVLAYCQWAEGHLAEARKTAEAFEKIKDKVSPNYQMDMMNYYAFSGDGSHIQQYYDRLERIIHERFDTISSQYIDLLSIYAIGLHRSGRYREAYETLDRHNTLNDSLTQRELRQETLKYAQQMKTQEKELQLKDKEAEARIHLIIIIALVAFLVGGVLFLWRIILAHRRLMEKNRQLFDTVQQLMREADERQEALSRQPEETLSPSQQLYNRICQLMREKQPYTDSDLNRDSLAQMLATNYNAVAAAIRECGEGQTIGDFLDDWRIRHAAQLVAETNNPVGLIAEQSGFSSRSHFNTLFREKFKMTPSEYRNIAKEKAGK